MVFKARLKIELAISRADCINQNLALLFSLNYLLKKLKIFLSLITYEPDLYIYELGSVF